MAVTHPQRIGGWSAMHNHWSVAKASRHNLLETNSRVTAPTVLSLDIGGQLVRLTEKTAAAAVLGSLALVVRHAAQASAKLSRCTSCALACSLGPWPSGTAASTSLSSRTTRGS